MPELTPSTREAARRIGITETALRKAATKGRIADRRFGGGKQLARLYHASRAGAYATANGIAFEVELPNAMQFRPKAYADNFKNSRAGNWTRCRLGAASPRSGGGGYARAVVRGRDMRAASAMRAVARRARLAGSGASVTVVPIEQPVGARRRAIWSFWESSRVPLVRSSEA